MKWTLKSVEKETLECCQHCGTRIKYVCWIESEDLEVLGVGRSCCSNFLRRSDINKIDGHIDTLKKVTKRSEVVKLREEAGQSVDDICTYLKLHFSYGKIEQYFPTYWNHMIK